MINTHPFFDLTDFRYVTDLGVSMHGETTRVANWGWGGLAAVREVLYMLVVLVV
jgi:hypothetical protein